MAIVLGLDSSTQSLSALLLDTEAACILNEASVVFGKDLPDYNAPYGFVEGSHEGEVLSDPRMWLEALDLCLERLRDENAPLDQVEAVSGAGQQHGTVYLNRKGLEALSATDNRESLKKRFEGGFSRALSPIWMDHSTTAQCREIEKSMGGAQEVCQRSGSVATERFSGPQIRRFAQFDPLAYEETKRIHLVSSFLASVLSGREAPIDFGDGAGMNLMNLAQLEWDKSLVAATAPELYKRLPYLKQSKTIVGSVASYFVERFGIPENAWVVAFTGDNPSSLVGLGASQPGIVVISLGTSDTLFAATEHPVTDPDGCGHVFGNPLGGYFSLQCFVNGSLAREKVRDAGGLDWDGFNRAIEATPVGNGGKLMLPFFQPEISPRVEARGPFLSGSFRGTWKNHPSAPRACAEGQFLNMWNRTRWLGKNAETVLLTGGGSRNPVLAQIIADVFQASVKRFSISGSVALGSAIRAADALDLADPDQLAMAFQRESELFAPRSDRAAIYQRIAGELEELLPESS